MSKKKPLECPECGGDEPWHIATCSHLSDLRTEKPVTADMLMALWCTMESYRRDVSPEHVAAEMFPAHHHRITRCAKKLIDRCHEALKPYVADEAAKA